MCGFSSTASTMASCGGSEIDPDGLGGLGDEVRIVGLAPRLAGREVDPLVAQEAPDVLVRHTDQFARQQQHSPAAVAGRRRLVEQRQDPLVGVDSVARCRPGPRQIAQPVLALARKTRPPPADPSRPSPQFIGNRAGRATLARQQNNAARQARVQSSQIGSWLLRQTAPAPSGRSASLPGCSPILKSQISSPAIVGTRATRPGSQRS